MKSINTFFLILIFLMFVNSTYAEDLNIIWKNDHYALDIALDSYNNVIITDYNKTIKYGPNGNLLWERKYGDGNDNDLRAVTTDSKNNVIVTGITHTIKYDPNGIVLWKTNDSYMGLAVAVDSKDNVIVSGGYEYYYFTIKYDSKGNKIWSVKETKFFPNVNGVAVDSKDNVIVTGKLGTVKYDPDGKLIWSKLQGYYRQLESVAVDSYDNIVVTGEFYTTIKYDSLGNKIWEMNYDEGGYRYAEDLAVDRHNNIIVTGTSYNKTTKATDYYTLKYDPNGNIMWGERYSYNERASSSGVAIDSEGNILVAGNLGIIKYSEKSTLEYSDIPSQQNPEVKPDSTSVSEHRGISQMGTVIFFLFILLWIALIIIIKTMKSNIKKAEEQRREEERRKAEEEQRKKEEHRRREEQRREEERRKAEEEQRKKEEHRRREEHKQKTTNIPLDISKLLEKFELNPNKVPTLSELKEQYRYWIEILHPDKNQNKSEMARKKAEDKLKDINTTYKKLEEYIKKNSK